MKSLRRARFDRVFAGVCGGIALRFGISSQLVRLIAVILALTPLGIPTIILYLALALLLPLEPLPPRDPFAKRQVFYSYFGPRSSQKNQRRHRPIREAKHVEDEDE